MTSIGSEEDYEENEHNDDDDDDAMSYEDTNDLAESGTHGLEDIPTEEASVHLAQIMNDVEELRYENLSL